MRQKPRVSHSTGQGVGGNAESEGTEDASPQARGRRTDNQRRRGRATRSKSGEADVAYGGGVSEAGMEVWGSGGDPGKPLVCPPQVEEGSDAESSAMEKARDSEAVGTVKERIREDRGGRWSRSTDGATRNGGSGKGSWLTEGDRRRPTNDARRERDARWEGTSPTLCSKRPKGGETGRFPGSVGNPREGVDASPRHPIRSRQRSAGNPPTPLGVADGGA